MFIRVSLDQTEAMGQGRGQRGNGMNGAVGSAQGSEKVCAANADPGAGLPAVLTTARGEIFSSWDHQSDFITELSWGLTVFHFRNVSERICGRHWQAPPEPISPSSWGCVWTAFPHLPCF